MNAMTRIESYISARGLKCLYCGAERIEGGSVEVNNGEVFQEMRCLACEATWQDVYMLADVIPE